MTEEGAMASFFFAVALVLTTCVVSDAWSDTVIAKAAIAKGYQQDSRGHWILQNNSTNTVDGVK